jgi:hypothetical protein
LVAWVSALPPFNALSSGLAAEAGAGSAAAKNYARGSNDAVFFVLFSKD